MNAGPLVVSSGDPTVDRRVEWARALLGEGNAADAAEMLEEVTRRVPDYLTGWFLLGEARETAGDKVPAAEAYARALALDVEDRYGAGVRLARLGHGAEGMSAAYVRILFDQYAERFDAALGRLAYRGPELVHAALNDACAALGRPFAFAHGIDLGCGTGLVGVRLAGHVGTMDGVDLSPRMIELARRRGIYYGLAAADMVDFLREREDEAVDLIFAGDAFCYLNELGPILNESRRVLEPRGLLVFTVETHDGAGILLRDTLRYAHAEDYVRGTLEAAGLELVSSIDAWTRKEKDVPVPGLVVVAIRGG
jgi:predicted TPR repeat methyltransferase